MEAQAAIERLGIMVKLVKKKKRRRSLEQRTVAEGGDKKHISGWRAIVPTRPLNTIFGAWKKLEDPAYNGTSN
jgi:hypothetical protein